MKVNPEQKQNLLNELKEQFEATKDELGFKASFEDVEEIFFINDYILTVGFVSPRISRQITSRIVDTLIFWKNYLYGVIIPNPQDVVAMEDSQKFSEEEKDSIFKLIRDCLNLVYGNVTAGLKNDKLIESKFIDQAIIFWNERFCPEIVKTIEKVKSKI